MYLSRIEVKNFRILKDSIFTLDKEVKKDLSLLIGRNNSGKTSFIVVFEKFFSRDQFNFYDFPLSFRDNILSIDGSFDENSSSIRLIIDIEYDQKDNLSRISELILDLDPQKNTIRLLLECQIDKRGLLKTLSQIGSDKQAYIRKNLHLHLTKDLYVFEQDSDLLSANRESLVRKELNILNNIFNFQVIHAKRSVASSDSNKRDRKVLSNLATGFYNLDNDLSFDEANKLNAEFVKMDVVLDNEYEKYFEDFLGNAKDFLGLSDLHVVSDLQSREILANHSKIVYGAPGKYLPEHLNGLGYMNILYLLLNIEIKSRRFKEEGSPINLLFIEEPEAHTHPQMQYVFIDKIKKALSEISNLQTIISTHSSYIVQKCDFKDIRYFSSIEEGNNISIKDFYYELKEMYSSEDPDIDKVEKSHFKFLTNYLTIGASELFFADKIIFIEGVSERLLMSYFIKAFDDAKHKSNPKDYIRLSSKNLSILEVGANAKAFKHFINFLGVKSLIITDIDTTTNEPDEEGKKYHKTCRVNNGNGTTNYTIKNFLGAPPITNTEDFAKWFIKLKNNSLNSGLENLKVCYQIQQSNGYHPRSFEDAFINENLAELNSLPKNIFELPDDAVDASDVYDLTEKIIYKYPKSAFASLILYGALTSEEIEFTIPNYIKNGLEWIT